MIWNMVNRSETKSKCPRVRFLRRVKSSLLAPSTQRSHCWMVFTIFSYLLDMFQSVCLKLKKDLLKSTAMKMTASEIGTFKLKFTNNLNKILVFHQAATSLRTMKKIQNLSWWVLMFAQRIKVKALICKSNMKIRNLFVYLRSRINTHHFWLTLWRQVFLIKILFF